MKHFILALTLLLLTTACELSASTAQPGQNPFTPAPDARLCAAVDLQASSNAHDSPDALALGVTLVNGSGTACSLQNPAQITLLDAGSPLDVQTIQAQVGPDEPGVPPEMLTVSPGESAVLVLEWRNACGQTLQNGLTLLLSLPGGERLEIETDVPAVPRCTSPGDPSTLIVNPYSYPP